MCVWLFSHRLCVCRLLQEQLDNEKFSGAQALEAAHMKAEQESAAMRAELERVQVAMTTTDY